jgi:Mg-chelatase subunit ChlD
VGNLSSAVAEGTRLDLAIARGAEALDGGRRPAANEQVLILMTDGLPNRVPTPEPEGSQEDAILDLSQQVKARDIRIYTIGVGNPGAHDIADRINSQLLRDVATDPSMYFETPDAEDLAQIYSDIAADVRGECP